MKPSELVKKADTPEHEVAVLASVAFESVKRLPEPNRSMLARVLSDMLSDIAKSGGY